MPSLPGIVALASAPAKYRYSQEALLAMTGYSEHQARQFFRNSDIEERGFALPVEAPEKTLRDPDALHRRFLDGALEMAERAARRTMGERSMNEIDLLVVATCTGYVCPSLSSRLVGKLDLRRDVQRCDLVGLGCGAALPALQRAADHAAAKPRNRALVIAVEVCSATYFEDGSLETALANALFADGAAAMLVAGAEAGGNGQDAILPVRVRDFQTRLSPEHIDYMGYQTVDGRLRIMISKHIREAGPRLAREAVHELLDRNGLDQSDIAHWVLHSGGRKVVDGIAAALELPEDQTDSSRSVLRANGNMSSPTVLFVLEDVMRTRRIRAGDLGVMLSLGPGFAAECALLQWGPNG